MIQSGFFRIKAIFPKILCWVCVACCDGNWLHASTVPSVVCIQFNSSIWEFKCTGIKKLKFFDFDVSFWMSVGTENFVKIWSKKKNPKSVKAKKKKRTRRKPSIKREILPADMPCKPFSCTITAKFMNLKNNSQLWLTISKPCKFKMIR